MKKRKTILIICISFGIILVGIVIFFVSGRQNNESSNIIPVKKATDDETIMLGENKYSNLIIHDFEVGLTNVEELYNIEIQSNTDYQTRTFVENFEIMDKVINDFFVEEFDKSYITADFVFPGEEEIIYVGYNNIREKCAEEKYNSPETNFLFGNNTSEGGYMVQIDESLGHIWFSKNGFGSIQPSMHEYKQVYTYLSGKRQIEDAEINLKDRKVKLSEMEEDVLTFLNESFPVETSENIDFCIGDARVIANGNHDGICFQVRRVYKGVPFEYGPSFSSGMYVDELNSDGGELSYVESSSPDTMLGFGSVDGTIVETKSIDEMISLDAALSLLSDSIGENSIYDVYGVELVYRECTIPEEDMARIDSILEPKWKIITINQNDDKYTLFYVDVVTGEISERFEYYYE